MNNLNIIMTIKANNENEAELIAKGELMELAKSLAMHNGSMMAMGEGKTTEVANGNYKVESILKIDGNGNINEVVYTRQALWMTKPNILKSAIFVSDEGKANEPEMPKVQTVRCKCCGAEEPIEDMAVVNPGLESEYYLCDECIDDARNDGDVILCDGCVENVDVSELIENPVTHEKNLCPYCGVSLL